MESQGLLRPVAFMEQLGLLMKSHAQFVEEGMPNWFNPQIQAGDLYTVALSAIVLAALKKMFLSFAEYRFLSSMKYTTKRKLFENLFYTFFYVISSSFGILILSQEDWAFNPFTNNETALVEGLFDPVPPVMSYPFKAYYATQVGYYIGLLLTLFMDTRRSDFNQYVIHHVTTLSLMLISFSFAIVRIGLVILILHDLCDVFLHGAKTVHYYKLTGIDTALFFLFAVSFFVLRQCNLTHTGSLCLVTGNLMGDVLRLLFPALIVLTASLLFPSTFFELGFEQKHFNQWLTYFDVYLPLWAIGLLLMGTLYLVNCFWMSLVLNVMVRELSGAGKVSAEGDMRSDSESDSD